MTDVIPSRPSASLRAGCVGEESPSHGRWGSLASLGTTRVAIFGIGNILLGDDGVGPAVAHFLESNFRFLDDVMVEDLGTPSLDLPEYLAGRDVVIFVDAVAGDAPAGTIQTYTREEIVAVAPGVRISPHEPSINDALRVLDFAGNAPPDVTLVGVVPQTLEGGVTLSPAVSDAVPRAAAAVIDALAMRGILSLECGGSLPLFP